MLSRVQHTAGSDAFEERHIFLQGSMVLCPAPWLVARLWGYHEWSPLTGSKPRAESSLPVEAHGIGKASCAGWCK